MSFCPDTPVASTGLRLPVARPRRRLAIVPLVAAAYCCLGLMSGFAKGGSSGALLDFNAVERAQIRALGPWPPTVPRDASNRADGLASAIKFGRELFSDTRLSHQGRFSCGSCHRPQQAFQDSLTVAIGHAKGVRNTPTLFDLAYRRWYGWDGGHDSLWWASLDPMLDHREMGHTLASLGATVRSVPAWTAQYRQVFRAPVPADDKRLAVDIAKVLAAYQATLISPRTAFDRFRDAISHGDAEGAAQYPLAAQRGLRLFLGEGRCTTCHAGAQFTNGEFADAGIPFFVAGGVDSGRHSGLKTLIDNELNRLGPFNDSGEQDPRAVATRHVYIDHRHFGEFKVPGLRQLIHTAPYMHNGSLRTLEAVVRHYSEIDPERLHADGERILRPLDLNASQVKDLTIFLQTLSSPALTGD